MSKKNSRQMRVSASHYDLVNNLADELGVSRSEIIANAVVLIKFLVDSNATSVRAICKDGTNRELMMTLLVGNWSK